MRILCMFEGTLLDAAHMLIMVNVLKFRTLQSILLGQNFGFYAVVS